MPKPPAAGADALSDASAPVTGGRTGGGVGAQSP